MLFGTAASRQSDRLLSAASRLFVRFASKKQGGSTSNGRDSNPKFLGLKAGSGQVRQSTHDKSGCALRPVLDVPATSVLCPHNAGAVEGGGKREEP